MQDSASGYSELYTVALVIFLILFIFMPKLIPSPVADLASLKYRITKGIVGRGPHVSIVFLYYNEVRFDHLPLWSTQAEVFMGKPLFFT